MVSEGWFGRLIFSSPVPHGADQHEHVEHNVHPDGEENPEARCWVDEQEHGGNEELQPDRYVKQAFHTWRLRKGNASPGERKKPLSRYTRNRG